MRLSHRIGRTWLAVAIIAATLAGCAANGGPPAAPQPAKPVDAARLYEGRWYEIGRTPMSLTDGCVAGTTDFRRKADGTIVERDACRQGTPAGPEKFYEGTASVLDPGTNAKISVRYTIWGFFPVWRTYWMLDHDDDYSWLIESDPAFENISLFTRVPRPTEAEIEALKARAQALGYDVRRLEFPPPFPPGSN